MYRIINEDNTLVNDYPSQEIYKTMSEEEKENIQLFKKEIEKITIEKGLGKVSVNISYDLLSLDKEFIIKRRNVFTKEFYDKQIEIIDNFLEKFSKQNNIYDFYLDSHIMVK